MAITLLVFFSVLFHYTIDKKKWCIYNIVDVYLYNRCIYNNVHWWIMTNRRSLGKLIASIAQNGANFIDKKLIPFSIGYGQFKILVEMRAREKVTQEELAARIGVSRTTLARTIKKLEALGFISRIESRSDQRAYDITLTDNGLEVREEVKKILRSYTTQLTQGIEGWEDELMSLLDVVLQNSSKLE